MKVAVISDTHFGYLRFEEDSFTQAENAFLNAQEKADVIIHAGDVFDIKVPKLESIHSAIEVLKKVKKPIYAIHGNHERRSKGMINPVQILAQIGLIKHLHGETALIEKNGEKVQIFGLGSVPEEYGKVALDEAVKKFVPDNTAFKILVLHQSIRELIPQAKEDVGVEDLEDLPFDLIINGHIHRHHVLMGGKLLVPGSTVITQLKKDEVGPKGYLIYDTIERAYEFVPIKCRQFFFEELEFNEASLSDIRNAVAAKIEEFRKSNENAVIRIKITGTLKSGLNPSDLDLPADDVQIDNMLSTESLKANMEKIRQLREEKLSVREMASIELREKTKGVTMFNTMELFDRLMQGTEEAIEYLRTTWPQESKTA